MPAIADPPKVTEEQFRKHQAKMEKVRENRNRRLPEAIRCLDADHAAGVEAQKPRYRFKITATVQEHDERLKRMVAVVKCGEVEAQSEDDAWALFCDRWKVRVGPKHCDRQIEKLSPARPPVEQPA